MLKRLSRDYWSPPVSQPLVKLALGLLGGPAIVVPLLLIVAFLFDFGLLTQDFRPSVERTLGFAPYLVGASIAVMATAGLLAFLLLWSLRIRSVTGFAVAGAIVGLISCALFLPVVSEDGIQVEAALAAAIGLAIFFALVMIAVRWIAGVRHV